MPLPLLTLPLFSRKVLKCKRGRQLQLNKGKIKKTLSQRQGKKKSIEFHNKITNYVHLRLKTVFKLQLFTKKACIFRVFSRLTQDDVKVTSFNGQIDNLHKRCLCDLSV